MKQPILVATIKLLCIVQLIGQNTSQFFQKITPDQVVLGENTRRGVFPLKFDTYQLDFEGIKAKLATAPWEFT
ncbi:MAG: hypothetical protein JNJ57_05400, partial [Saprospiraceae bacterium]|nr:hypothetical protein [Saprospiraceae bacterium]